MKVNRYLVINRSDKIIKDVNTVNDNYTDEAMKTGCQIMTCRVSILKFQIIIDTNENNNN